MKKVFCFCTLLVLLFALPVQAGSVTYNNINPLSGSLSSTLTTDLPMFNVAGATLTGVQITLNLEATPYAEPFNFSSSPVTFTTSDWASCSFPPTSNPNWTITYGSANWTFTPVPGTTGQIYGTGQTIGANSGLILLGSTSFNEDWTGSALSANLADYIGAGTLSFGVTGAATYTIYDQSLYIGGGVNLAGTTSVTYTYTPEPATMALLGLGAFALRRRKA